MKKLISILIITVLLAGLSGCSGNASAVEGEAQSPSGQQESLTSGEEKIWYVGTRGTFLPYTYMDENDNLTGFDVEVIREIGNRIDGVQFEFKTMTLDSCFVSLEANQIDIIANQLVHNAERDQKYTFTEIPYSYADSTIAVSSSENSVSSLEDLKGKTIALVPTAEAAKVVAEFNATADPPIEIVFNDNGSAETLNLLATGRVDATIAHPVSVRTTAETMGYEIKTVGEPVSTMPTYFILRQDEEARELAGKMDEALQTMKDDGTLLRLSEEFLEGDYVGER